MYLIEELLQFYSKKDAVIYKTNETIKKLKDEGLKLTSSYNQMVQSRAEILQSSVESIENDWQAVKAS